MPLFKYRCGGCSTQFEHFASADSVVRCPNCDKKAHRQFTLTTNFSIPPHMRAGNDDSRHRAWVESPAVQAKLKSGEYEPSPKSEDD